MSRLFENAKVGDDVFTTSAGWVKIEQVAENGNVKLHMCWYLCDGRRSYSDMFPSAWSDGKVPQYYLYLCPKPKRKIKKKLERWVNVYMLKNATPHVVGVLYGTKEEARHFADFQDGTYMPDEESVIQLPVSIEYEVEE